MLPDHANASLRRNRRRFALGLALSGGGSRAAAFHCGTLKALAEIKLLPDIDVVSTVSGGSLFGAAWAASLVLGDRTSSFLSKMERELAHGFVGRTAMSWAMLRALFPGFSRTYALGMAFDRVFFNGLTLGDLPKKPLLCMNATVLNNGQVAKFGPDGFRATGLTPLGAPSAGSEIKVWLATIASASHPAWLPPVILKRGVHFPSNWSNGMGESRGAYVALTDGGVLENLGLQTLLNSRTYGVNDVVASDAGVADVGWAPDAMWTRLLLSIPLLASFCRLYRATAVMSRKQDRHMRSHLFLELENSRLKANKRSAPRRLIMVRVDQTLKRFLSNIPQLRLDELSRRSGVESPRSYDTSVILRLLRTSLDSDKRELLDCALDVYDAMGGDNAALACSRVRTDFTALPAADINRLREHAYWQTLACFAVYW